MSKRKMPKSELVTLNSFMDNAAWEQVHSTLRWDKVRAVKLKKKTAPIEIICHLLLFRVKKTNLHQAYCQSQELLNCQSNILLCPQLTYQKGRFTPWPLALFSFLVAQHSSTARNKKFF